MDPVHFRMDLIQKPGDLPISEENIIGPFDYWRESGKFLDGIRRGDSGHQGDQGA